MAKVTLNDVQSGYSAPATINANNDAVAAAIENTLSRDGTGPNQMEANLDLNGHRIINLPAPAAPTDPARYADLLEILELDPTGLIVPTMTGNGGKVLTTDGSNATWGNVDPDALPLYDGTDRGAVPPYGALTDILTGDGWSTISAAGLVEDDPDAIPAGALNNKLVTLAYAGSRTIDTSLGNAFVNELTGSTTYTFTNPESGRHFKLFVVQDATGGRGVTWPASIVWSNGQTPTVASDPNQVTVFEFWYDGTDWFGVAMPIVSEDETSGYDLVLDKNEMNIDLFRRLGSPSLANTYNILVSPGVVIHSVSTAEVALELGGAFPSGTAIYITNKGYILGRGGRGGIGAAYHNRGDDIADQGAAAHAGQAGGNAIGGPATGVTVYITNAEGRVWGGGGGGGGGGVATTATLHLGVGGSGGGGAGCGEASPPNSQGGGDAEDYVTIGYGNPGRLGLDGTDAGGAGLAGAAGTAAPGAEVENGGDGGDYGAAGSAGSSATASDEGPHAGGAGGAAGRAVSSGYAGTLTFLSGGTAPNVKGSV